MFTELQFKKLLGTARIVCKVPVIRRARSLTWLAVGVMAILLPARDAQAQGCIVARSSTQLPMAPEAGGEGVTGYTEGNMWDVTIGYRHQFSFKHFVGPTEQTYRVQQGTQVMNKINLEDINLTYTINSRWSVSADMPLLFASRRGNSSPYTLTSSGIGDATLTGQAWLFNPHKASRGNIQLGLGVLFPTGRDNVTNVVDAFNGKGPQPMVVDYSIQPGQGKFGLVMRWQTFLVLSKQTLAYFNGNYIAMPATTNNVLRTGQNPTSLTAYNAVSDQYLLQAGITRSFPKVRGLRGLTWSLGPRMEGVPARNLFPGDNLGFRRPGFAISLEPGLQYSYGNSTASISVGKAIYRDRTRSVPDILTGGHGDAAFADYVWLASYSYRFGGHGSSEH